MTRAGVSGGLTVGVVVGLVVGLASPAHAQRADDDEVRRTGSCSGAANWQVRAKHDDDGRIEFRGRVEDSVKGAAWRWRVKHNGSRSASGNAVARGASASFEVRRTLVDLPGVDRCVFRAVRPKTGEVCRGVVDW